MLNQQISCNLEVQTFFIELDALKQAELIDLALVQHQQTHTHTQKHGDHLEKLQAASGWFLYLTADQHGLQPHSSQLDFFKSPQQLAPVPQK
ncbi:hypothetical protein INR49_020067 [Caranx melampygus]|nr:hypothetical protein INR49_020067 [Caranx melampygus]